jgi:hypothetical protein
MAGFNGSSELSFSGVGWLDVDCKKLADISEFIESKKVS